MRILLAVLAVFVIIVALGFWTNHGLKGSTGQLLQNIDRTTQDLSYNQWDAAYGQTLQLETAWDQKAAWWPVVLDHSELDGIRFDMGRLKEYIAAKNTALAWGQLEELRLRLEHIPEKEAITLKNIL